jgi:hypothetical protein
MVYKRKGKLKATERWKVNGQNTEVVKGKGFPLQA